MEEEKEIKKEDSIKIDITGFKKGFEKTFVFFTQKKVINIFIIIVFILLLIGTSWIRLQNLPFLIDQTTGKNIPLALDPFYFLRVAETIAEGGLPEFDLMRYLPLQVGFSPEILPNIVVFLHKIVSVFSDITLQYIFVISPVIFFVLGLIAFFFLIFILTKSKWIALLSSIFLAIIPTYLYRTMAGFVDHEAIGMFAFFLTLLFYSLSLKFLDNEKNSLIKTILFGLFIGFLSAFTMASWGGISSFVFIIIPLSFGIFWLIKVQDTENLDKPLFNFLVFYLVWFLSSIVFSLFFGFGYSFVLGKIALSFSSLINSAVLLFIIIDFCMIRFGSKILASKEKLRKYRVLFSMLIAIILGIILLSIYGTNILSFIPNFLSQLSNPFSRTGLTVAENAPTYLVNWINQMGKIFFWIFYMGMVFVGFEISKGIKKSKNKIWFTILWVAMISGILFSRISATSTLNGVNFLSSLVYFGSLLIFLGYCIWLYFNDDIKIETGLIIIASWLFFMLIAGRGAIRLLFVVTPFVSFMVGYSVIKLFDYVRKSKEILRLFFFVALILVIMGVAISSFDSVNSIKQQAKYTGPSAHYQWQNSMAWVRDNTPQDSIFVHWWDYGYWIQYLGERPTVTDGGHANNFWDHLIGRYVLTTPNPETALSFMKTQNVSYLLIDPTDLGKYPAYGRIGSDDSGIDRYAGIPIMQSDPKQTVETSSGTTIVYMGSVFVDEDIIYRGGDMEIFLPAQESAIIGIVLEISNSGGVRSLKQPEGVFFYKDQQVRIPLRYVYVNDKMIDFNTGLDAIVSVIPKVSQSSQGIQIDGMGTVIYLSPKVSKSLFAQLYLLDDIFNNYPTLTIVHSEQDISVTELNNQGANVEDLIYFNGFRGPIKIWKVDYPDNIIAKEEFLRKKGEYARFDDLKFSI